jgi:hypothetical protein
MYIRFIWFRIGSSVVLLSVNDRDVTVFSKGKGGRSSKLTNIGYGVCAVHKLRKLYTKYKMLQV